MSNKQPAAWGMEHPDGDIIDVITPEEHAREEGGYTVALYREREWVGLTDEQIHIRYKAMRGDKSPRYIEIYRDCENAHGIKGK